MLRKVSFSCVTQRNARASCIHESACEEPVLSFQCGPQEHVVWQQVIAEAEAEEALDERGELEASGRGQGAGLQDAAVERGANSDFETAVLLPSPLASPGWVPC